MKTILVLIIVAISIIACKKESPKPNVNVEITSASNPVEQPISTSFQIKNTTIYHLDLYLYNDIKTKIPYKKLIIPAFMSSDTIFTTDTIVYVDYHIIDEYPYIVCHLKKNAFNLIKYIY